MRLEIEAAEGDESRRTNIYFRLPRKKRELRMLRLRWMLT